MKRLIGWCAAIGMLAMLGGCVYGPGYYQRPGVVYDDGTAVYAAPDGYGYGGGYYASGYAGGYYNPWWGAGWGGPWFGLGVYGNYYYGGGYHRHGNYGTSRGIAPRWSGGADRTGPRSGARGAQSPRGSAPAVQSPRGGNPDRD